MSEQMDFAGGKYTVINDNGKLTALRYGEPWGRDDDLVGDNLVYSMLVDSMCLKAQRDALLEALEAMLSHTADLDPMQGYRPEEDFSAVKQARAAIAAVEGEKE
jgi:hypothetical protein